MTDYWGGQMIKCKKGIVKIKGDELADVLAEFTAIVHGLKDMLVNVHKHPEDETDKLLETCFKLGLESAEKIKAEKEEVSETD